MNNKLKNHDWLISIISIILQIIGVFVIFSSTYNPGSSEGLSEETIKQIIFVIAGLIIYFALSSMDISWLYNKNVILILYIIVIILLVYVRIFGEEIANTNRWIKIGFFSFQPAEYAKLIIILLTGYIFSTKKTLIIHKLKAIKKIERVYLKVEENYYGLILLADSFLFVLPILILILIQPALGNTVISFLLWFITAYSIMPERRSLSLFFITSAIFILFITQIINFTLINHQIIISIKDAGDISYSLIIFSVICFAILIKFFKPSLKSLLITLSIVVVLLGSLTLIWNNILTGYQKGRIEVYFQGPESDPYGVGYQVIQSRVAIGSGMIFGKGYLAGSQSSLNVLTQAHNDFIFASYAEQFGFVGVTLLLILYLILIIRVIFSATSSGNDYGRNVGLSVSMLLLLHIFINIGMNLGLLPVTGIPLPLMSSGGSSILVIIIALGFVQSINSSKRPVDFADSLMLRSTKSSSLEF